MLDTLMPPTQLQEIKTAISGKFDVELDADNVLLVKSLMDSLNLSAAEVVDAHVIREHDYEHLLDKGYIVRDIANGEFGFRSMMEAEIFCSDHQDDVLCIESFDGTAMPVKPENDFVLL